VTAPFTGIPFVMGSIRGERSWNFDIKADSRLLSPTFPHEWVAGENQSICQRGDYFITLGEATQIARKSGLIPAEAYVTDMVITSDVLITWTPKVSKFLRLFRVSTERTTRISLDEGRKALLDWRDNDADCDYARCSCGFYAYLNGVNEYHMMGQLMSMALTGRIRVTGIVEGYGETFIGTRGFRAKKAKIVALYAGSETARQLLARQYPDVPIYRSLLAMRAEYPPTKVDEVG
jgi:hypothetical protein